MSFKKLLIPSLILISLTVYFLASKANSNSSDQPFSDFAYQDTASIDQVRISNTVDESIIIQRRSDKNQWYINNSNVKANKEAINRVLATVYQWKVLQDIDDNKVSSSIAQLSVKNHKVELFKAGKPGTSSNFMFSKV